MRLKVRINTAAIVTWLVLIWSFVGYCYRGWSVQDLAIGLGVALVLAVLSVAERPD